MSKGKTRKVMVGVDQRPWSVSLFRESSGIEEIRKFQGAGRRSPRSSLAVGGAHDSGGVHQALDNEAEF
jgi:hypothetical protein